MTTIRTGFNVKTNPFDLHLTESNKGSQLDVDHPNYLLISNRMMHEDWIMSKSFDNMIVDE